MSSALEVYLYTTMRYINRRFTYLITYLLTVLDTAKHCLVGDLLYIWSSDPCRLWLVAVGAYPGEYKGVVSPIVVSL